jgi:hypothetical protein
MQGHSLESILGLKLENSLGYFVDDRTLQETKQHHQEHRLEINEKGCRLVIDLVCKLISDMEFQWESLDNA